MSTENEIENWCGKECEGCSRKTLRPKALFCAESGCPSYCHKKESCSGFTSKELMHGGIWKCHDHSIKCLKCGKIIKQTCKELDRISCNICKGQCHKACTGLKRQLSLYKDLHKEGAWTCDVCFEKPLQKSETIQPGLTFLQWNARGINKKSVELRKLMKNGNVNIVLIQETKLTKKSITPEIHGYSAVRLDRPSKKGAGGLLIYVNKHLNFKKHEGEIVEGVETGGKIDKGVEMLSIRIKEKKGDWLDITNVYWPPAAAAKPKDINDIIYASKNCVIAGDFNGHHTQWDSYQNEDQRGKKIEQFMSSNDIVCCNNKESHTRKNPSNTRCTRTEGKSSPDITLVSNSLEGSTKWRTHHDQLGSDHLPILFEITGDEHNVELADRTLFEVPVEE